MCFARAKPCSIQKACGLYNRSAVELHQRSSNERPQGTTTQWTFTTLGYSSTICWLVFHRPCLSFWAQKPDICKKNLTIGQEEHLYLHRFVFGFRKGHVMCIYISLYIHLSLYIIRDCSSTANLYACFRLSPMSLFWLQQKHQKSENTSTGWPGAKVLPSRSGDFVRQHQTCTSWGRCSLCDLCAFLKVTITGVTRDTDAHELGSRWAIHASMFLAIWSSNPADCFNMHPAVRLFFFDSLFHQVPLYVSRVARAFIEAGFDPIIIIVVHISPHSKALINKSCVLSILWTVWLTFWKFRTEKLNGLTQPAHGVE